MNILFVSTQPIYKKANHAGGQFVFDLIKELSKIHKVSLLCLVKDKATADKVAAMSEYCEVAHGYIRRQNSIRMFQVIRKVLSSFSFVPLDIAFYFYPDFDERLKALIQKIRFDVIHFEFTASSLYLDTVLKVSGRSLCLLDEHDVAFLPIHRQMKRERNLIRKVFFFFRYVHLRSFEQRVINQFDFVFVRSEKERKAFQNAENIRILRHGIKIENVKSVVPKRGGPLVFFGKLDRSENLSAVFYIIEHVLPFMPGMKLFIVGANPPKALKNLENDNIKIFGWVDDIYEVFNQCSIFVSPILVGGGTIVKNLEAMMRGLPVVTTSIGNNGIEACDGKEIMIADSADEFVNKIRYLYENQAIANEIGLAGKHLVESKFSLNSAIDSLYHIYNSKIGIKI